MINTVIFDWSGVLSDDWEAVFHTANNVLEARGHRKLSMEEFRENYELPWANFYKNMGMKIDMKEEYRLWHGFFPTHCHSLKPLPNAKETLQWMRENGIKAIVFSSHNQELLEGEIEKYGFSGLIEKVDASNADKREKIEELVASNKLERDSTIFVGDMCHDIETARLAGIKSVAVLSGYDSREKLEREKPDFIINGVEELPGLIEKMEAKANA